MGVVDWVIMGERQSQVERNLYQQTACSFCSPLYNPATPGQLNNKYLLTNWMNEENEDGYAFT